MSQLVSISSIDQIPERLLGTPIGDLLAYHNFNRPHDDFSQAKILIGMCMDHRKRLNIPENFAYIIRTGGANLQHNDFHISFAIAVGGVSSIALIGHSDCGMVNLESKREIFVEGLNSRASWEKGEARKFFDANTSEFGISDAAEYVWQQAAELQPKYPGIQIVPLFYRVEDNLLSLVNST